jgi:hypothetical protein
MLYDILCYFIIIIYDDKMEQNSHSGHLNDTAMIDSIEFRTPRRGPYKRYLFDATEAIPRTTAFRRNVRQSNDMESPDSQSFQVGLARSVNIELNL